LTSFDAPWPRASARGFVWREWLARDSSLKARPQCSQRSAPLGVWAEPRRGRGSEIAGLPHLVSDGASVLGLWPSDPSSTSLARAVLGPGPKRRSKARPTIPRTARA